MVINVEVKSKNDESFERLLKRFLKKIKKSEILEELKNYRFYKKPSQKRHEQNIQKKRILNILKQEELKQEQKSILNIHRNKRKK